MAPFFCPDPTHKMGTPPPAWCIENTGVPASLTEDQALFPPRPFGVSHTWLAFNIRLIERKGLEKKKQMETKRREAYNELLRSNQKVYKRDVNINRVLYVNDV